MRIRNSMLLIAATALAIGAGLPAGQAESVVRYGISMADIPLTTGQPDRGAGAYQFTAYTIYDPLVAWEMDVVRPARQTGAGARHRMEGRRQGQDQMALHACARASNSMTAASSTPTR